LPLQFHYSDLDEIKGWPDGKVWMRKSDRESVLNQDLSEWIKIGKHHITSTFFGAVSTIDSTQYTLYQKSGETETFNQIKINNPWVAGKSITGWQLMGPGIQTPEIDLDSIGFAGPIVVAFRNDSTLVCLPGTGFIPSFFSLPKFMSGGESDFFLRIDDGERKKIYNNKGEFLFASISDVIEYNNEGYFTIHRKGKKGLLNSEGKPVLHPVFDAIGTVKNGVITVLKDQKFGLINLSNRKVIKTEYEKNVLPYNQSKLIAFRDGAYAIITWDNKPLTSFEFEEIRYWNDSSALVKKSFNWILYNFIEKKILIDKIKKFKWVQDTEEEKVMVFQQENSVGVLSNKRGTVITPTFSDIINVGSSSVPLYFTEKHVEEAGIYVVIYYNKDGHQLRKQVYEVEEYERIFCTKNHN